MSATILPFPGSPAALDALLAAADAGAWAEQHLPMMGLAVELLSLDEDQLLSRVRSLIAAGDGPGLLAEADEGLGDTKAHLELFTSVIAAARARLALAAARVELRPSLKPEGEPHVRSTE